ncbi:MAG: hypothetical protein AB7F40_08340 [Victivallaceae bacterium]|nr:hypothetical protein [Victivallaceae bacterium]
MKRKINGLWLAVALIAGIGWAALLIFWPQVCSSINAAGIPLARSGRFYQATIAATGFPAYYHHLSSVTPILFYTIILTSSTLLGIAVFAFLAASKKWKYITIGWFGVYVAASIVLALCCRRTWLGWGYCLAYLAPLGYYLVAFCGISLFTARKWGLAAGFAWWMFVLWCGINISMFPMRDFPRWEMINTPGQVASSIFMLFPALPASLDKIIIIAVNGILYATGIYVLLRLSLSRKLVAGGIIAVVVCLAGLIGNDLSYSVVTGAWFLVAAALFGWFFIVRGDAIDEDSDTPASPNDITFVNRVIEQEKFALNPDKTTFFHLEGHENWVEDATQEGKSKSESPLHAKAEPAEEKKPAAAAPSPAPTETKQAEPEAVEPAAAPADEAKPEKKPAKRGGRGGAKKAPSKKDAEK